MISGNTLAGINIQSAGSDSNTIRGNYIGTDATGTAGVPNASSGIVIGNGDANVVGGPAVADGNVISSNIGCNVCVFGPATNTDIRNNLLGTNADATATLLGSSWGIMVSGDPSGTTAINNNTVGGNGIGIYITASVGILGYFQAGNTIGTDQTGATILSNTGDGLYFDGGASVWQFGLGKIAYNGGNGVGIVGAATSNIWVSNNNEIHDNGGLGID